MEIDENQMGMLGEKAWELVEKINDEIESEKMINFCKLCSEHGLLCGVVAETPMLEEQRQRLVGIRDSLKHVENMLVFLQRLQSYQRQHYNDAITRLEESRLNLMEKIQHFQQNGTKQLEVIEELNSCFGDEKLEKKKIEAKEKQRKSWFFINCITSLFNPWNWHNSTKNVMKLVVVLFTISSSYRFYKFRQENLNIIREKCASPLESSLVRKREFLLYDADSPLDVSYAMG